MSTGHTHASAGSVQRFGKAQCNASIEPGAALGDRLRRIETSIEDLSSYPEQPYCLLCPNAVYW